MDRALSVVLVGVRVAEVDQQAIAEVLRDVATVTMDGNPGGFLVGAQHRGEHLGIEVLGEGGGVDDIAVKDGDLAALGHGRAGCDDCTADRPADTQSALYG